jgi:hypothetical protein
MKKKHDCSGGVLICRCNPSIQCLARRFLGVQWWADRIDCITHDDPLHMIFHDIDREGLEHTAGQIESFLERADPRQLALAADPRPGILTDEEVKRKINGAVTRLSRRFPDVRIVGLFVKPGVGEVELIQEYEAELC